MLLRTFRLRTWAKEVVMNENVSDFLVERLASWGVKRIFGYPGDGINGIIGALNRGSDKLDFIQVGTKR